ncbi:hypothetical protein K3495_g14973, partial [Podosphaera aphanis]
MKFNIITSSTTFVDSCLEQQACIFTNRDVSLPHKFTKTLSYNGKFIPHSRLDTTKVEDAICALRRTIRTRWLFRNKVDDDSFVRKFHVPKTHWEPPIADSQVEAALRSVIYNLRNQTLKIPRSNPPLQNPDMISLCSFLKTSQFLVNVTDKNLGLAVMSKSWYNQQLKEHLSNPVAYRQVKNIKAHISKLHEIIVKLTDSKLFTPQERKFLASTEYTLPKFYVIPKVHKTPWSSRPIIPCHSWATSKASIIVDHYLQPILKLKPQILNSTKSFLTGLRQAIHDNIGPNHQFIEGEYLFITGDVTAMYTNISPHNAINAIHNILEAQNCESNTLYKIKLLIKIVLSHNFFQCDSSFYKQLSGLAMGTSCAPTIANLYAAYYEEEFIPKLKDKGIIYYGRYIDDIFIMVKNTPEAIDFIHKTVVFEGLKIVWSAESFRNNFLDVDIFIANQSVTTNLYSKKLNKHMYIPYSSAHPITAKKAFVKAERTRYALICSTPELTSAADYKFRCDLLKRGYPSKVLDVWFKADLKPHPPKSDNVCFVPSTYNPVWKYIDMRKAENAFMAGFGRAGLGQS